MILLVLTNESREIVTSESIALSKYTYGYFEKILGQDLSHSVRPSEHFEENIPIATGYHFDFCNWETL